MISTKFNIGQQVRHKLLGYLGVVIDVDPKYLLEKPPLDDISFDDIIRMSPWYHVIMEDEEGKPIHTYLSEIQLEFEFFLIHPEQPTLDELSESIRLQFQSPRLRN